MRHAVGARYGDGSREGCLKGTRKEVLWEIECWLNGKQGQRVFWLNGLAGTGKSTIAKTFAEISFADGKLGASFFCSRDSEDHSNLQMIFPTLAFQLACQYPLFRKELLQVLRVYREVEQKSLCSQMKDLIVGPLKATNISTLIIIDALDECKDKEPASAILSILSCHVDKIPNVKFFITGRPEVQIRSGFRLKPLLPITSVLKLHEVKPEIVDDDIKQFFQTKLADLAENRSDCDSTADTADWPSPSDIEMLCKKATGFFIYASTVVKFVSSGPGLPTDILALNTSLPQNTTEEGKSGVDQLYTQVLQQAFQTLHADNNQQYLHFLQTTVGTILLIFNPLSIKGLSELLGCSTKQTRNIIRSLHSLLLIPENTEDPIQTFHKSFPDFLLDPERCQDKQLFVDPAIHHAKILLACLRLMEERLKRNICNLGDYAVLSEVKDLSTQKKAHIGGALEYACRSWTKHLLEIPINSPHAEQVQKAIEKFFAVHLLHWIEVLALTSNLGVGVHAMNDIEQWYNLVSSVCIVCWESMLRFFQAGAVPKWTNDSQRFLLEHFDTIHNSPLHIYHSALPLSPSSSWLRKCYSVELSSMVKVVKGLPAEWGKCSRTVDFDSFTNALSYHDNRIAIGSGSGDITIINAITGSQVALLSEHTQGVNSLAFSSDGTSLVSGSDDSTVKLWDVQTGGVVKIFHHNSSVSSVSISVDCTMLASGAHETFYLWDIQTEKRQYIMRHQNSVEHISFSPTDPRHLIFRCGDKLWQWNTNGHPIETLYHCYHAAFSPDGTKFVSCYNPVITVQNSDFGAIVAEFQATNRTYQCCCFSPDGRLVAVAGGNTIHIWDINSSVPYLVETFIGHTGYIESLVFSSPTTLISASQDKSVKFWQIGTLSMDPAMISSKSTFPTSAPIKSITLQKKDGIIITSDSGGIVKTWDISTGLCNVSFQTPAKYFNKGDARLINGRLIFVWNLGQEIYIWDAEKGEHLLAVCGYIFCDLDSLRISGDGSRDFSLSANAIDAWSVQTGETIEYTTFNSMGDLLGSLTLDGSKVWAHWPQSKYQGWDFGIPGSPPVQLSNMPLLTNGNMFWDPSQARIKNAVTGEVVFQLSGRFSKPVDVQCDGSYLVAGYQSVLGACYDLFLGVPCTIKDIPRGN